MGDLLNPGRGRRRALLALALSLGAAGAAAACGSYRLAFYELGLLYYRDAEGQERGIDRDLVDLLARRSGCRFHTLLESRVRIWDQLARNELDLSVSGIPTPERERFAEFLPYFQTRNYLVVRRDLPDPARRPEGFLSDPGLKIAVVKSFKHGALYDAWLERLRRQAGRVVEAADFDTVLKLFKARRVDAFLALPTSWLLAARAPGLREQTLMLDWSPQDRVVHGLIVSRQRVSEADRELLRRLMAELRADGSIEALLARHLGPDLARQLRYTETAAQ